MRLFKALVVVVAMLDAAMFLQSPSSPLSATSPTQAVGYATPDMSIADAAGLVSTAARP